jgi:hypothetical protein
MPILVTRKGILRSFIHAANLVKLLFAFVERSEENTMSSVSTLVACPDRAQLMMLLLNVIEVVAYKCFAA